MTLERAKWDAVREEMRALMIEQARLGRTITYSELARSLQTAYVHYHSHVFVQLLIDIGRSEQAAERPILPALVVSKQTGMPGGGYFRLSEIVDPADLRREWENDLQEVYHYWSEH